ncbi:MAG: hypothetical protein SFV21_02650 [Rhodospirillaceae bacterium]|nr:hypothetical protein [Rhodospirillaceae bacterium]
MASKAARKSARKASRTAARAGTGRKSGARRATPRAAKTAKAKPPLRRGAPTLVVPADLESRLLALALQMEKTFDAVLLQALAEFADAWEDHFRTVAALADDDDRVQLSNRPA